MFQRIRSWLAARQLSKQRTERAERIALEHFARTRETPAMGAFVLLDAPDEIIVRVMFITTHIPPNRAWFAISTSDDSVRELTFEQVEHVETKAWR